ncbi:MAG: HEPN domain-containing protein [Terriglobia bacterium]
MALEREIPGSPSDWLRRARSDLALAEMPLLDAVLYEDLCFHCQQAAEKAIKAVYRSNGREFRYTHDLTELLDGLAAHGISIPEDVREAVDLTPFAWQALYPGPAEPVTQTEYQHAAALAERVVK